jgi:hypothetical protein
MKKRIKTMLALTFFLMSILCFVVQAADLPCCNKCDPFCEYTQQDENGQGWLDCKSNSEPPYECDPEVGGFGECNSCE